MKAVPHLLAESEESEPRTKLPYSAASLLAHDARNWLTVLQMYCDLLRTCGREDVRYPEWTRELSAALRRGKKLVGSLLEQAQKTHRPEGMLRQAALVPAHSCKESSTGVPEGGTPLDVAAAVAHRLPLLQRMAGSRIHVVLQMETARASVAVSEMDFDRILQNLFQNAIQAMPRGGLLRIELSILHVERSGADERASRTVVLRISDTGPGISPSLLERIFEPGVSGKKICPQDRAEHGLGLAVVRDLTLRAGGAVRVRSRPGGGASFEVELPAARIVCTHNAQVTRRSSHGPGRSPLHEIQNRDSPDRQSGAPRRIARAGPSRPPSRNTQPRSHAARILESRGGNSCSADEDASS
ncbi:MAG TPA: HAMP domain-containing sensor histidine kinase [Acidobacteriaceae bacterium]|nr:HAMP domain-containing sensor histidine kinase [Acidobacteriaceae bacterium]